LRHGAETEGAAFATDLDAARKLERFAAIGLLGEVEDGVDVNGTELAGARFDFFDEEANQALAHGLWCVASP